jgi:hypothetical protein
MEIGDFVVVPLALFAFVRPDIVSDRWNRGRRRRLDQLEAGAEEGYFEERRQLEAYPIRHLWTVRLIAGALLLLELVRLLL